MAFDFRGFFRFSYLWLSTREWTPRRVAILIAFYLFFPLLELTIWVGFLLDNILFPGHRSEPVESPVFIVGNPRSGTTFLHRLLSRDVEHFSTMKMWEILFAPSIAQRRIVGGLAAVDRWLGGILHKGLDRTDRDWRAKNAMHEVSLREPEEDDYLLLHIWSALTTGLSAGLLQEAMPYTYFDTALAKPERRRIMAFYKRCVQRHLHAQGIQNKGGSRQYLAKNPALCPKLDTVLEHFPDAKIIYLVRSPLEMLPSYVNMMIFSWRVLGIPVKGHALRDYLIEMSRHWYTYPLERLARTQPGTYAIVKYDDMVAYPEKTVREIYGRFGFEIGPAFSQVLQKESARAARYQSRHGYSPEENGLNRRLILEAYQDIFDRFGFDTSAGADS